MAARSGSLRGTRPAPPARRRTSSSVAAAASREPLRRLGWSPQERAAPRVATGVVGSLSVSSSSAQALLTHQQRQFADHCGLAQLSRDFKRLWVNPRACADRAVGEEQYTDRCGTYAAGPHVLASAMLHKMNATRTSL
jgi:hypothetical protein